MPFPKEIAMFGLPMGAVVESWPESINSVNLKKPTFSTFVLCITSDDGSVLNEKVYGSTITFYEEIENTNFIKRINNSLGFTAESNQSSRSVYSNKSLILLSRHPLFGSFIEFLLFIFNN